MSYICDNPFRILFVCLGNICRSPAAHGIMQRIVDSNGMTDRFVIDSAGLYSGHKGQLPDPRMRAHAAKRGLELTHRARPVRESDFDDFDVIVAMDDSNFSALCDMAPTLDDKRKVVRMADYCRRIVGYDYVPDPYYEGASGFELVLDLLEDACAGLCDSLTGMNAVD